MPLYKHIIPNNHTHIYVWKITETLDELSKGIRWSANSLERLSRMKSEVRRKGFASIRMLLQKAGYQDGDLYYTAGRKPILKDGMYISISHSFGFSAIAISRRPAGIDIEKKRDKIKRIAGKFAARELTYIDPAADEISLLTVLWGAKESLYKIYPEGGLSFNNHLYIEPFNPGEGKATGYISKGKYREKYRIHFWYIQDYILVYAG